MFANTSAKSVDNNDAPPTRAPHRCLFPHSPNVLAHRIAAHTAQWWLGCTKGQTRVDRPSPTPRNARGRCVVWRFICVTRRPGAMRGAALAVFPRVDGTETGWVGVFVTDMPRVLPCVPDKHAARLTETHRGRAPTFVVTNRCAPIVVACPFFDVRPTRHGTAFSRDVSDAGGTNI